MWNYFLYRIALFLPTLLVISLVAFGLSKCSPIDPVLRLCGQTEVSNLQDVHTQASECRQVAAELGLDKPTFYLAIRPTAFPDTLYRIFDATKRRARHHLVAQYGNWEAIQRYFDKRTSFEIAYYRLPETADTNTKITIKNAFQQLNIHYHDARIRYFLDTLQQTVEADSTMRVYLAKPLAELQAAYHYIQANPQRHLLYLPAIHWYGTNNQYHHWIRQFFKGDFGVSYYDRRPVQTRIWEALRWTLCINILAILLAYIISVLLGVTAAQFRNTWKDRLISLGLFVLYALPSFWVATLLIVFVTTSEYGMNFFPTGGVGSLPDDAPFWLRFWDVAYHLILPVFCVTYTAFAFIARQIRGSMLDVLYQNYMTTARAKGLSNKQVIWKHGFRNALFPIITLFASVFPATLAGSVIVEVIFNIPGMGRLAYEALYQGDWPVVYTILMFAAILTMVGNLVADVCYVVADPRVTFDTKTK